MATIIRARELNSLSRRLDALYDRIKAERDDLPQQRQDATGNAKILAQIVLREDSLRAAAALHHKGAVPAWKRAVAALASSPRTTASEYTEAVRIAQQIEDILDYRDESASEPATSESDNSNENASDTSTASPEFEIETSDEDEPQEGGDEPESSETDEVVEESEEPQPDLLREILDTCKKNHQEIQTSLDGLRQETKTSLDELRQEIDGIARINPEVAKVLNTLNPGQLDDILNRRGLDQRGAVVVQAIVDAFDGRSYEEIRAAVANLASLSGRVERARRILNPRHNH